MTSEMTRNRLIVILLFTIAFTMVGWLAPMMYASYVPQEQIIEEHKFTAQATSPDSSGHYLCFDRTVHQPASAETFTELYIVNDNGERIEVASQSEDRYFQDGRSTVVTWIDLPEERISEGVYRYLLVAKLELAGGRVERTLTFESASFTVASEIVDTNRTRAVRDC